MSRRQWGHGYYSGAKDGVDYGVTLGEFRAQRDLCSSVDVLLDVLEDAYKSNDDRAGFRFWTAFNLLRMVVEEHSTVRREASA